MHRHPRLHAAQSSASAALVLATGAQPYCQGGWGSAGLPFHRSRTPHVCPPLVAVSYMAVFCAAEDMRCIPTGVRCALSNACPAYLLLTFIFPGLPVHLHICQHTCSCCVFTPFSCACRRTVDNCCHYSGQRSCWQGARAPLGAAPVASHRGLWGHRTLTTHFCMYLRVRAAVVLLSFYAI